jgi:hypothetical protein
MAIATTPVVLERAEGAQAPATMSSLMTARPTSRDISYYLAMIERVRLV